MIQHTQTSFGYLFYTPQGTTLSALYRLYGFYAHSSRVLMLARDLFPTHSEHSHIWQLADLIIKFEKALFQSKWLKAEQTQKGIAIFDNQEGHLRKAQLLFYQGNLAEADVILNQLLNCCENKQILAVFYARIILLRSELLSTTPNNIMALPLLMTNLAKCETYHLSGLLAATYIHVAALQLELGLPKQAIVLLDQVHIYLLANGTFYDRGCCCFLYARCLAFSVIQSKNKLSEYSKTSILKAIAMSAKALESFKAIKAVQKMKSVLFWQAYIYNYLGMKTERNDTSYRYRSLSWHYFPRFNSCQVIYSQFGLAIHQNDHQARRRFVEWAQNEIAVVPDFHKRILFSDEAHFWLNGNVNKQNCRIWSEANPQVYVETPLHPEKLTVWCALWAGGILLQKR
ncbi:anaphase-promoting complex subunit 5 [Trichonephila clavipes]|nr:anaphase-promoting complex subunit 5 [Trichonephila clavipes]